jgi:iron complex transport system ATP-binding protein
MEQVIGSCLQKSMPILVSSNLEGGYANRSVLHDLNLEISQGEWLSILGANGSGKSTLLKLISRLLSPQRGTVLLNGKDIHRRSVKEVARELALLPQQMVIPQGITVAQLVSLGRNPYQAWWQWELDQQGKRKVLEALHQTAMLSFADRPVETLSGGERQRAFLALALAQDPQVLLLDEPTTFLDMRYQLELLDLLQELNRQQGLTIVTVLHDMNLAGRYSDRLAVLKDGRLYAIGHPQAVLTKEVIRETFGLEVAILPFRDAIFVHALRSCSPKSTRA